MFVAFFAVGEGWHNYHHAFPWDYRASELGTPLNMTGFLIDILARFGLVYDRKEASHNVVKSRAQRTGDDSHAVYGTVEGRNAFRTLFNMWRHPANPTYTSLSDPHTNIARPLAETPAAAKPSTSGGNLISKLSKLMGPDVLAFERTSSSSSSSHGLGAKTKNELNINVDDVLMVKLG